MSPRHDVSEERRSQILDAATQVFSKKGFDHARMDDIVEETGLSKGALYWYFKSKDDIIFAIIDRIFQHEFKELREVVKDTATAADGLRLFTDVAIQDIHNMIRLLPIAYEFLALAFRNKAVQRALKSYMNSYMEILLPVIQRGVDSGEFRDVDPMQVGLAAGAIIEGTMLLWVYDKSMVDPEQNIRTSMELLLTGVQK
jgi:AcrR family transcriptional regulator